MNQEEQFASKAAASLTKERPNNETEKRFVLSPESFSKERLQAVKDELAELKTEHPEVLSLCMFGSMVKGTAHAGSDIDAYLYIDSELAAKNEGVSEDELLERDSYDGLIYFKEITADKYATKFREGIKAKTGLGDDAVEHIRSRPISEKVINDEIESLLAYYRGEDEYETALQRWFDDKPPHGSEIEDLLRYEKARPESPERVSANLGTMFHLDVGGGIRKYRKLFVDKLNQLGTDGERIWEETIRGTELLENNLSLDETKRYPRLLKDAVRAYSL